MQIHLSLAFIKSTNLMISLDVYADSPSRFE